MGTRELEQWIRQLCCTTLPVSSMNELAERCVTEGWETVGEVLAAVLPEPDLASLGLINYVAVHRSERAVGCTGDNEGRRATAGSDSGAGCCGGKDGATSADPDAAAPAAAAVTAANNAGRRRLKWRARASPATEARTESAFVLTGGAVKCGMRYGNTTRLLMAIT